METEQKSHRGISLIWKLFLALVVVSLIGVGSMAWITSTRAQTEVRGLMMRGGINTLDNLTQELAGYYRGRGSWAGVEEVFPLLLARRIGGGGHNFNGIGGMMGIPALVLADESGRILVGSPSHNGSTLSPSEIGSSTPIDIDGKVIGYLADPASSFIRPEVELLDRLQRSFLLAATVAVLAALLVGGIAVISLLRPVRELTEATKAFARGEWEHRVPVRTSDEVGELSRAFNTMAESLQKLEQRRRETTADIAHELRTPLAVMQARLEAIIDGVHQASEDNLTSILNQTQLMNRLVEDLHTLSMADAGALSLIKTRTDLGDLAARSLQTFASAAGSQGLSMEGIGLGQGELEARVDAARIEQVLGNLLSNALRHTPYGGTIRVVGEKIGTEGIRISVEDSGEGVEKAARVMIFERFYRLDSSRSRHRGGSGLGLSVAKKLVEAHSGRIWVEDSELGGARFSFELPIAAPDGDDVNSTEA
jgi:two-component system sensor histidine kinase BaeS